MYSETEGSRKTIGDVDVLYHEGLYHLFHLVLPNHDFIAHAVSTNGINWRRVSNALFIGDPGSWDDLMLWTMHVSPDPHRPGRWRMFYTGLSRREQGRLQRIGVATSDDLFHWTKVPVDWHDTRGPHDPEPILAARQTSRRQQPDEHHAATDSASDYPLEPAPQFYERSIEEGRRWISFRDPFYYHDGAEGWLLAAGRTNQGPVIRRGCISVMKETSPDQFEALPPLYAPQMYDDIEVPNLIKLDDEYYLIGSIREDAKIRYWHTDEIGKPWLSYHDNVLMAKGNYAGRVSRDDKGWLLWNFFVMDAGGDRTASNVMPPPKRLVRTEEGLLRTVTFEHLDEHWIREPIDVSELHSLKPTPSTQAYVPDRDEFNLACESGFQAYVVNDELSCFRLRATLTLDGRGKCGLVFRVDRETHDGYYLSLDLLKGVAQLRSWKTGPVTDGENMLQFKSLQNGYWHSQCADAARVQLIAFGSYLEFSVNGYVLLSMVDQSFEEGLAGFYLETAKLRLSDVQLERMRSPRQSDDHLVIG